ncbi:mycothiol system anti-sigma-R factor [Cumulibacter soli]|uniref:mycothiol system anti-sigma-R factor n=1 Tax=Cumulibacter soli TaxID=2546344 RepID=UPI0010686145|nr:mycothiol system anti-sigma-R factor [Cumulibacter soli]
MNAEFNVSPCGGEHELACGEFLVSTSRLTDESCDEAVRRALQHHVEECGPCASEYTLERHVKSLVGRCCGAERAPDELRTTVQQRIHALTVQMSSTTTVHTDGVSTVRTTHTVIRLNNGPRN